MDRARRVIDQAARQLIGDGDVSHLPGAGAPLDLGDNPLTPSDQRAAQKIMRDHNVQPDWITAGQALRRNEAKLSEEVAERARRHLARTRQAQTSQQAERTRKAWSRYRRALCERVERHNRETLNYNLAVPAGIRHQPTLEADALLEGALSRARQAQ